MVNYGEFFIENLNSLQKSLAASFLRTPE